jgi:hypothetical protein
MYQSVQVLVLLQAHWSTREFFTPALALIYSHRLLNFSIVPCINADEGENAKLQSIYFHLDLI